MTHRCIPAALALLFTAAVGGRAAAQARIEVQSAQAAPGTSGFVDVVLNPNGTTVADLQGFYVSLALAPGSPQTNVRFAAPYVLTPANYVYASIAGATPAAAGPSGGYRVDGFRDVAASDAQTVTAVRGLVRVPFDVAAGTARGTTFAVTVNLALTTLANTSNGDVAYTSLPGTITVVPEPATGLLLAGTAATGLLARRRRRQL